MDILVVDDDVDLLNSCRIILQNVGYKVHTYTNSEEALEFLKTNRVSLVITDLMMGELDEGVNFVRKIRGLFPDIPIVMVTGISSKLGYDLSPITEEDKEELMIDEFVNKPLDPKRLVEIVRKLTDG